MPQVHAVRPAAASDLPLLAGIEADADRCYADLFGALSWAATSGRQRDALPGFLLVAGEPPVGFAHVLEVEGEAHLEQLAVRPAYHRGGLGTALVEAALAEARSRAHRRLTLSTFRDVAWNAPFYRGLGFTELAEPAPFHERVRRAEERMGLLDHGPRVLMEVRLDR